MKRVRKKSYLVFGLIVFILAAVALTIILLALNQGTVEERYRIFMIVLAATAGAAGVAGLIGIILFFAKTYPVKENQ